MRIENYLTFGIFIFSLSILTARSFPVNQCVIDLGTKGCSGGDGASCMTDYGEPGYCYTNGNYGLTDPTCVCVALVYQPDVPKSGLVPFGDLPLMPPPQPIVIPDTFMEVD